MSEKFKHSLISIFFSHRQHLMPLPAFVLLYSNIAEHMAIANASEPVSVPVVGASIPIVWLYLLANCVTQNLCLNSVFVLTTECNSLTVTLVVTLRKFISLLFSIIYFNNPFTVYHWIGTALVFLGTLIFTEVLPLFKNKLPIESNAKDISGTNTKPKQH